MIEKVDHQRAVRAQTDIGPLINVADVDQERISILPAPAPNLGDATREAAEVRISCVIARGQNVSVEVGRVKDRDLNRGACRAGAGRRRVIQGSRRTRNSRRRAKQTGSSDRLKERAPSGGTHLDRHINIGVGTQFYFHRIPTGTDRINRTHKMISPRAVCPF